MDERRTRAPLQKALRQAVLRSAFRGGITAPDADSGIEELARTSGVEAPPEAWREAVSEALAAGLIHDPVRLPAGALQCHWRLELTPAGVEAARRAKGG